MPEPGHTLIALPEIVREDRSILRLGCKCGCPDTTRTSFSDTVTSNDWDFEASPPWCDGLLPYDLQENGLCMIPIYGLLEERYVPATLIEPQS